MHTLHKLLFAKHCTCYCVCLSIWPTKFKITLSFLCKTYFVFENFKGDCLKILNLGKSGLKLVLWKSISSHTHAFYFLYSMLWGVFSKIRLFFLKRCFFPDFRLIQSVFRSIEISFKILGEPLSVSIDRNCFSINRNCF